MNGVKVGDKVRFLNAVGGGVVTRFQGKDVVFVEGADGFEIPVLVREVVVVQPTNQYNFPVEEPKIKASASAGAETADEPEETELPEPEYSWNEREETPDGEQLSLYLAFVPKDIKQLQTTDMELYLINDSNYFLQFALYSGADNAVVRSQNMIEPQTKLLLETVNKLALNEFERLRFQAFAYKRIAFTAKPVMDISLKINPVKFYKLHSFRENDFFYEQAMMLTLVERDVMNLDMEIDPHQLQKAIMQKELPQKPVRMQKKVRPEIIEVDLHIDELLDSTAGMSNYDMLKVQMDKFHEVMRANLKYKGQKIVFIHGKGEGVLRAEIEKQLKSRYRHCEYQDASFQQYGFGATQVTIH